MDSAKPSNELGQILVLMSLGEGPRSFALFVRARAWFGEPQPQAGRATRWFGEPQPRAGRATRWHGRARASRAQAWGETSASLDRLFRSGWLGGVWGAPPRAA